MRGRSREVEEAAVERGGTEDPRAELKESRSVGFGCGGDASVEDGCGRRRASEKPLAAG
jgi:hypothetical protein